MPCCRSASSGTPLLLKRRHEPSLGDKLGSNFTIKALETAQPAERTTIVLPPACLYGLHTALPAPEWLRAGRLWHEHCVRNHRACSTRAPVSHSIELMLRSDTCTVHTTDLGEEGIELAKLNACENVYHGN